MTINLPPRLPALRPRVQRFLKLLALVLMIADHIHYVFFNRNLEWLYWLSRIVFPIFALIVAQNLEQQYSGEMLAFEPKSGFATLHTTQRSASSDTSVKSVQIAGNQDFTPIKESELSRRFKWRGWIARLVKRFDCLG